MYTLYVHPTIVTYHYSDGRVTTRQGVTFSHENQAWAVTDFREHWDFDQAVRNLQHPGIQALQGCSVHKRVNIAGPHPQSAHSS